MRNLFNVFTFLLFGTVLFLSSCKTVQKLPVQQDLIVGEWVVESVNVGGEVVPASLLGGLILFEFKADGTAHFTTPDGQIEKGRYQVRSGKIYDPDSPADDPVDIISLSSNELVISMIEEGERMEMTLRNRNGIVSTGN